MQAIQSTLNFFKLSKRIEKFLKEETVSVLSIDCVSQDQQDEVAEIVLKTGLRLNIKLI